MEETFVEVADEEPRPGEISRESFSEIAGIYVFNALPLKPFRKQTTPYKLVILS